MSTCTTAGELDVDTVPSLGVDTAPALPPGGEPENQSDAGHDGMSEVGQTAPLQPVGKTREI